MLLDIYIPEDWPPEPGAADVAQPTWLLRELHGRVARSGRGLPSALANAGRCRLIVPAGRVTLSQLRPPAQNRKKFMQALAYAVEDRIMTDPEGVHVAAGEMLDGGDMPVAIVERAWLRRALDSLKAAGLHPDQAMAESHDVPLRPGEWSLVWRGHGGFLCQDSLRGMVLDGGRVDEPPLGLVLALGEASEKPVCVQVYTDDAPAPDTARWSTRLGVPVKSAGPWEPVGTGFGINLLQGDFAPAGALHEWLPRLRPALALVGLLIALHVIFSVADWTMLRHQKKILVTGMELSFRSAFPEAKVVVDAPLQMARNIAGLRHAAGQPDRGDFMPLLAGVAPLLGEGTRVRQIDYQPGRLKLALKIPGTIALEALRKRLQTLPQARLESGPAAGAELEAKLTVSVQP